MRKRKDIKLLEEKIQELTQQKNELLRKQADILFKKTQTILGDIFSPELALTILSEAWQRADNNQKEFWQSSALTFRPSRNAKSKITNKKNNSSN
jgi:hypothetical protein